MKKLMTTLSLLTLTIFLTLAAAAQSAGTGKAPAAPRSDEEIQKCILDAFAKGASLKDQKLSVTVSNGVATITGTARNQGSKGAASRIAKSCGAREVKNEAAIEQVTRPKKKEGSTAPKNQ